MLCMCTKYYVLFWMEYVLLLTKIKIILYISENRLSRIEEDVYKFLIFDLEFLYVLDISTYCLYQNK